MTSCRQFKSELEQLVANNPKNYHRIIRCDAELFEWISQQAPFSSYLPEMVFFILHPEDSPYCASGNRRKFRNINTGWNRCNDPSCSDCKSRSVQRSQQTNLLRYGVSNPMQLDSVKERVKSATDYDQLVEKRRATYINQYGVDHPWKTSDGQAKRKQTLVEKYGVDNPSKNPEIQLKKQATCVDRYGADHHMKDSRVKQKLASTCLELYGVDNPSKLPEVRQQARATSLDRYGVEYAAQLPEFVEKAQSTCIARYGVAHVSQDAEFNLAIRQAKRREFYNNLPARVDHLVTPLFTVEEYTTVDAVYPWVCNTCGTEFKDHLDDGHVPQCPVCYPKSKSQGEDELAAYIESLGFDIIRGSRSIIAPLELDVYVESRKIAFEYNGIYRHSEVSGGKDRNYHLNKLNRCNELGIALIQIYDSEWLYKNELVKSRIAQKLGLHSRIYARKCSVVEVSPSVASDFLNKYHIQGSCGSSIKLGLVYNNELVAVMTFGKSRYYKHVDYELLRFCSKINTTVVGGASKLLAAFEHRYNNPTIVSYCDLRWNRGNVYEQLGFTLDHTSKPNCWYHRDNRNLESRIKYQKHKLANLLECYDPQLSEWDNMRNNKYDRIWDCGNAVYFKNLNQGES